MNPAYDYIDKRTQKLADGAVINQAKASGDWSNLIAVTFDSLAPVAGGNNLDANGQPHTSILTPTVIGIIGIGLLYLLFAGNKR